MVAWKKNKLAGVTVWCCLLVLVLFWSFHDCRVTVLCIHLCWRESHRKMLVLFLAFEAMLHLPLRFSFKSTWKSISPFLTQMCMVIWGNTLLLQWPQLCWWLLTLTAPMAPVASAGVVWPQILTEATRGKKDLGATCCLVKWCQSTLFFSVFWMQVV